jgi:hypothetical protein
MKSVRRPAPSTLERALIGAARTAEWVDDTDQAAYWLCRDVMLALDGVRRQATLDGVLSISPRDLAELAGRGIQLLRELGLTPAQRHRMGLWEESTDDAFAKVLDLVKAPAGNPAD